MTTQIESQAPKMRATGIPGLDMVLGGGFRPSSVTIIEGLPGTGKTILASQLAHLAAMNRREASAYVSFETPKAHFDANFASLNWNHPMSQLHYLEVSASSLIDDFQAPESKLEKRFRDERVGFVIIDCLTPVRLHFLDRGERAYREFLQKLFDRLRALGVVTLVLTEAETSRTLGQTGTQHEHFLADMVITLRQEEQRRALLRSLEVAKSRGQKVLPGRHAVRIESGSGFRVYPRAYAPERLRPPVPASKERVPFGIPGLEDLLGGGLYRGSSTLIVGISGTGKTISAMHFLSEGLKRGENCLLVSLDDTADQFCRDATQIGFKFDEALRTGQLTILNEPPLEIELDAHFCEIERVISEKSCQRVVIDSVATYEMILPHESHEFLMALSALMKGFGVTSLFAYESPELLGVSQISKNLKASSMADNIILFNYVEISTTLRRALTVPKARGSTPDQQSREYVIRNGGLAILDESTVPASEKVPQLPLSCYYGVLARSPTRHSPIIDESVAAGKPMPKSKIPRPIKKPKVEPPPKERLS